jgi:hypothetical protein
MTMNSLLTEEVILHTPWPALVAINALNERVKQLKAANEKLLAYLHEDVTIQSRKQPTKKPVLKTSRSRRNRKNQGRDDRDRDIQSFCSSVLGADCGPEDIQRIIEHVTLAIQGQTSSVHGEGSTMDSGDRHRRDLDGSNAPGTRRKLMRHYQRMKRGSE